jgi:dihydropteroate synthase
MNIAGRGHPERALTVGEGHTRIMGVINVTPDSFSDGGQFLDTTAAIEQGVRLRGEGADILDIGGESTRPGYAPVSIEDQKRRVVPVIEGLRQRCDLPIAVDTTRADVATAALDAGADWINDTTALAGDPEMAHVIAERGCPVVLMHQFDPPRNHSDDPKGGELVAQMVEYLEGRVACAESAGINPHRILLDPGLGFGTLFTDNLSVMADIGPFRRLQNPLLFGPSRKSFIGQMTGKPVEERLYGTAAAAAVLAFQGVEVLRVHDVAAIVDVVKVADQLRKHRFESHTHAG